MNKSTGNWMKAALILFIIGIVMCIVALALGGNMMNDNNETLDLTQVYTGVESIQIDLGATEFEIQEGNEFKIEAYGNKDGKLQSYVENGIWTIKEKTGFQFGFVFWQRHKIIVTIPEGFQADKLSITVGAGKVKANQLRANSTYLEVGAGSIEIDNLFTNTCDIDSGVGSVVIYGNIMERADIDCGVGSVYLDLTGDIAEYNYELDVGIGDVVINDKSYSGLGKSVIDNKQADKTFKIDCGVGKVELKLSK